MRRKEREITEKEEIKRLTAACGVCSLAFNGEEYPYVVPVNFGELWDGEQMVLYIHGAGEGTKIERMNRDSCVAFCMYAGEELKLQSPACGSTMLYSSVCGSGRLQLVEDAGEKLRGLECIMRHFDEKTEQFEFNEKAVERTAVLKLTVEQYTAKSNRPR